MSKASFTNSNVERSSASAEAQPNTAMEICQPSSSEHHRSSTATFSNFPSSFHPSSAPPAQVASRGYMQASGGAISQPSKQSMTDRQDLPRDGRRRFTPNSEPAQLRKLRINNLLSESSASPGPKPTAEAQSKLLQSLHFQAPVKHSEDVEMAELDEVYNNPGYRAKWEDESDEACEKHFENRMPYVRLASDRLNDMLGARREHSTEKQEPEPEDRMDED